jgi:sensor histidine kinase YesM
MKAIYQIFKRDFGIHIPILILVYAPPAYGISYLLPENTLWFLFCIFLPNSILLLLLYGNAFFWIKNYYNKGNYARYFLVVGLLVFAYVITINTLIFSEKYLFTFNRPDPVIGKLIFTQTMIVLRVMVISILVSSLNAKQEQQKTLEEIKIEKLRAEMALLKSQINPHFLFNTLNSLYGLTLEKSDSSPEIVLRLSKIMDFMLHESTHNKIPLMAEIDNIKNYLEIEGIRQGNNAKIHFTIAGEITNQEVMPLVLLPLIENAFKHGVNKTIGGFVDIRIMIEPDEIKISVRNSTPEQKTSRESEGTGLTNLKKRLELAYPSAHTLQTSESIATRIFISELKIRI